MVHRHHPLVSQMKRGHQPPPYHLAIPVPFASSPHLLDLYQKAVALKSCHMGDLEYSTLMVICQCFELCLPARDGESSISSWNGKLGTPTNPIGGDRVGKILVCFSNAKRGRHIGGRVGSEGGFGGFIGHRCLRNLPSYLKALTAWRNHIYYG